jgi:VWFA-related protein
MTNSELTGVRIRRKGRSLFAGALFFLGTGVVVLQAGWAPPAMTQGRTATLDVAVIERDLNAFGSLTKEEFTVYEDGVKQEIISLTAQESPFSLGIAIDASSSMRAKLQLIQGVALNVISRMRGSDEACIVVFRLEPELFHDFTSNQRDLANAIGEIYTRGATSLFDAIVAAADHVYEKGKSRRKALLFITDGLEKKSSVKEKDVITALIENQAQAYFVCLPDDVSGPSSGGRMSSKACERLDRLARASGGQSFLVATADEAVPTAAKLVGSLRRQYEIAYVSTNNKQDDKLRKVSVVVSPKDGRQLNVITRQGYYGPAHKKVL